MHVTKVGSKIAWRGCSAAFKLFRFLWKRYPLHVCFLTVYSEQLKTKYFVSVVGQSDDEVNAVYLYFANKMKLFGLR